MLAQINAVDTYLMVELNINYFQVENTVYLQLSSLLLTVCGKEYKAFSHTIKFSLYNQSHAEYL